MFQHFNIHLLVDYENSTTVVDLPRQVHYNYSSFLCDSMQDDGDNAQNVPKRHHQGKKRSAHSLKEEYEKKRAEDEKAKKERDAIIQAKREHREKSEAKRKELREKMFKKTRSGQPVMRYRIEHLLETALSK